MGMRMGMGRGWEWMGRGRRGTDMQRLMDAIAYCSNRRCSYCLRQKAANHGEENKVPPYVSVRRKNI